MIFKTIDDIQRGLENLGHPASLSELAWVFERTMDQKQFAQILERAHFEAKSRDAIEFELNTARIKVRAAHDWIIQADEIPDDYFKPHTIAGAWGDEPAADRPSQTVTAIGRRSFATFWTCADEQDAPALGINCCDLKEEIKPVKIILPLQEIIQCLMVLTNALEEAHGVVGILRYYTLTRADRMIILKVGNESIHHLVEMDAQGAFALASLLTAQIRLSMPEGTSQDLPFLIDKVLAPLHNAQRVPCK